MPTKVTADVALARMRAFAARVNVRMQEYRRNHPGQSVPIDDTLSRILEHDPEYTPPRPRTRRSGRPPLLNPGIFTVQAVAEALETTVSDLLAEPQHVSPRDLLTPEQRRTLRDATGILRALFDLDDPTIGAD
jgi:hypothetical protein